MPYSKSNVKPLDPDNVPELKLRPLQQAILDCNVRFQTAVIHRRYGKTVVAVAWLIDVIDKCEHAFPRCYFVFPFANQAEEVAWDMLMQQCAGRDCLYDSWKKRVTFHDNGGFIQLVGSQDYDRHRGKYADGIAFDELCDTPPAAWYKVFRPMLSDRLGKALFIMTPRGHDWGFDLYNNGLDFQGRAPLPGWRSYLADVYSTGVIDPEEIQNLKREMASPYAEGSFEQEYLCDFEVANQGAFYQHEMNALLQAGRAGIHRGKARTDTAWYFDRQTDQCTVTFWQRPKKHWHCVEVVQELSTSIGRMAEDIAGKNYEYGQHRCSANIAPGSARWRIAKAHGIRLRAIPALDFAERVELSRDALGTMSIDSDNAGDLIEAGRQFHSVYDEDRRMLESKPYMNWAGFLCESLAVHAVANQFGQMANQKPIQYPERWRA